MLDRSRRRRPDRLGRALGRLAQGHASLQKIMADFGPGIQRRFDQVAVEFDAATKRMDRYRAVTEEHFRETAECFRATAVSFRETDAQVPEIDDLLRELARENARRSRELDERIDKLLLAIGEFIRNRTAAKTKLIADS
jgi:hypothetical protein